MGAVAEFPFPLPPGFSFPDTLPMLYHPTVTPVNAEGDQVAFGLWRCAIVGQAASVAYAGDLDTAHALLAQAAQVADVQLAGNQAWVRGMSDATVAVISSEQTLCETWLGVRDTDS